MGLVAGKDLITLPITQGGAAAAVDLIAAPNGAQRIVVISMSVALGATAGSIKFTSGTTDITGAQTFAINGGMTLVGDAQNPVLVCNKGEKLAMTSTGSGANGWLNYYLSPT